jgi:cysteine-rich repeat protein
MHRNWITLALVALVGTASVVGLAVGAADPAGQCAAGKLKASGKKAAGKTKCYAKAVGKGTAVAPACLTKEETKFDGAIAKAESKAGCATPGNGPVLEQLVDEFIDDVVVALTPGDDGARKCAAAKLKATGKKADAKLKCEAKPLPKGGSVDAECLAKAEAKFSAAFSKAEAKGGCTVTNDAAAIEQRVDELVEAIVAAVTATTTTATTATTTTATSTTAVSSTVTSTTAPSTTSVTTTTTPTTSSTATTSSVTTSTATTTSVTTTTGGQVCGNSVREGTEQCDDGNDLNTDACTTACQNARCGDGFAYQGVEQCDDGNTVNDDFCRNDCTYAPAVCGDGVRQFGETCDDGNTLDGDDCPSDCTIASCVGTGTRQLVTVNYTKPAAVSVGGIVVFLHYPDGTVGIPGLGNAAQVRARILNLPTGFTHVANDLDYAIRETLAPNGTVQGATIPQGQLFRISFDLCFNASPPVPGNFSCVVESASTPAGQDIDLVQNSMTCSVTVP